MAHTGMYGYIVMHTGIYTCAHMICGCRRPPGRRVHTCSRMFRHAHTWSHMLTHGLHGNALPSGHDDGGGSTGGMHEYAEASASLSPTTIPPRPCNPCLPARAAVAVWGRSGSSSKVCESSRAASCKKSLRRPKPPNLCRGRNPPSIGLRPQYISVYTNICQYIPIHTSIYNHIQVYTRK